MRLPARHAGVALAGLAVALIAGLQQPNPQLAARTSQAISTTPETPDDPVLAETVLAAGGRASKLSSFAGASVDAAAGRADIYLTNTDTLTETQIVGDSQRDLIRFHVVPHSFAELSKKQMQIVADLPGLRAAGVDITRSAVSAADSTVFVAVTDLTTAKATLLRAKYGDTITPEMADPRDTVHLAATRLSDVAPWNGGDFIRLAYSYGGSTNVENCTSGPPVLGSTGFTYLLTAGHCDAPGTGAAVVNGYRNTMTGVDFPSSSPPSMGTVTASAYNQSPNYLDSALIKTPSGSSKYIWGGSSTAPTRLTQSGFDSASLLAGLHVCITGAFEGAVCNNLIPNDGHHVNICVNAYDPALGYITTQCSLDSTTNSVVAAGGGDSGAPVYRPQSDGTVHINGTLSSVGAIATCGAYTWRGTVCSPDFYFTDIGAQLNFFNITLKLT